MRFRFTTRDLFWFALVVALMLGWAIDRQRIGKAVADMKAFVSMAEHGGEMDKATLQQYRRKVEQLEQRLAEAGK
jgi:hypothetical protein